MSSLIKNLIMVLGLVLIVALGYYLFVIQGNSSLNLGAAQLQSEIDLESQQFLRKLNQIQNISLDVFILNDPRLTVLIDSKPLPGTYPIGRPDPFAKVN